MSNMNWMNTKVNVYCGNNGWNVQALEYNQGLSLVHIISIGRMIISNVKLSKMKLSGRFSKGVFRGNSLISPCEYW